VEKENTMFWGSELESIHAALKRNNITIEGKYRHCTAFNHFKFNIKNLREFTRVPFENRPQTRTSTASGSGWNEGVRRLPPGGNQSHGPGTKTNGGDETTTHLATLSERTESPLIRTITTEFEKELKDIAEEVLSPKDRPSRPTSKKRLKKVRQQLFQLGVKLDSVRCFTPTGFREYKNHNPVRGAVFGKDRIRENLNFECPNVPKALWDQVRGKKLYGRISNIRNDGSEKLIVVDYAQDLQERFIDRYRSAFDAATVDAEIVSPVKTATVPLPEDETGDDLTVEGPMGTRISKEDFQERVKHGCSNCTIELSVADAQAVVWAGPLGQYPICGQCVAKDPQVQAMFASITGGI